MHNLLNFLVKHSSFLLFIMLEALSFYCIFTYNAYQKSFFLNSSNVIVGNLYESSSKISEYFGLRTENTALLATYGELNNKITSLENYIFELTKDSISVNAYLSNKYNIDNQYIVARIIKNSVSRNRNFITINKGKKDSIAVGMAVISTQGAVGEVSAVSDNFAVIQPLININTKYSGKLIESESFGPIYWLGEDPRYMYMNDVQRHEAVNVGDTIVTSGYSGVFPSGVMIGTVQDIEFIENANNYKLTIELSTNFSKLKNVLIVKRDYLKEIQDLEKSVQ